MLHLPRGGLLVELYILELVGIHISIVDKILLDCACLLDEVFILYILFLLDVDTLI